ncbi:prepilin-type N-terminal cleavage/methylation domain-containing protein [Thermodesulfobacteriota bacterium]
MEKIFVLRKSFPNQETKNQSGFTMIEIMIVIAIIAIMAAWGIPAYMTRVERARAMEAAAYFKDINEAETAFNSTKGNYYPTAAGFALNEQNLAAALGLDFQDSKNFAFAVFIDNIATPPACIQIEAQPLAQAASAATGIAPNPITAYRDRTTTPEAWAVAKNTAGKTVTFQSPMPAATDATAEAGWEASINLGFWLNNIAASPFGACVP